LILLLMIPNKILKSSIAQHHVVIEGREDCALEPAERFVPARAAQ
jgi:hypothetical protein